MKTREKSNVACNTTKKMVEIRERKETDSKDQRRAAGGTYEPVRANLKSMGESRSFLSDLQPPKSLYDD
jgi:hypothetical protein